jgi:hypothetical protein
VRIDQRTEELAIAKRDGITCIVDAVILKWGAILGCFKTSHQEDYITKDEREVSFLRVSFVA